MTSWNGNIFRVNGHLCDEFIGPRFLAIMCNIAIYYLIDRVVWLDYNSISRLILLSYEQGPHWLR